MNKKNIKYLIMDVDGTLTNGKIYMSSQGELFKAFNVKDGYGIRNMAIANGIVPIIITGRESDIVLKRCSELGITEIYQGITDKRQTLSEIVSNLSLVAYIGDDINDLDCMHLVKCAGGLAGCPKDAVKQIIEIADYVAEHDGGDGAVRDFIEWILRL